jgi:hypothetical protein
MSVESLATDRDERPARSRYLRHPPGPGLQFDPRCYHELEPDGENGKEPVHWTVTVAPHGHVITRKVRRNGAPWNQCGSTWEPDGCHAFTEDLVIWPAWPARSHDEATASPSPLAGAQDYWGTVEKRLRESAKWTAAVLGAALATLIGTSPLAGITNNGIPPPPTAILLGGAGLLFLGITMFLVVQVMRPQAVSFADVQNARNRRWWHPLTALRKWQTITQTQQDLYLPCGVKSLTGLRQSMIIEEMTLVALSRATATARDRASCHKLGQAQAARAARLRELRAAAAMIATIGEYYTLRYRSSWATYGGILCGLLGTAATIAAFAWPVP